MFSVFIKNKTIKNQGFILITVLSVTEIFLVITLGMLGFVMMQYKLNINKAASAQALHIAEAGVENYRWILYHNGTEYTSRSGYDPNNPGKTIGPYRYSYKSYDGTITGYYDLYLTPPGLSGSTIVNVKSTGWEVKHPNVTRTIEVRCGIPSWASFSVLANDNTDYMRFGTGTEVYGEIFSNFGIHFDGLAHNLVSSGDMNYNDPDHSGANEFGVHTHIKPPPLTGVYPDSDGSVLMESPGGTSTPPVRDDVFIAGRTIGATPVDFGLLGAYVNSVAALATSTATACGASTCGLLFDPKTSGYDPGSQSGAFRCGNNCSQGYHIIFSVVGTTTQFIVKGVSAVKSGSGYCGDPSYSIQTEYTISATPFNVPPNGIIFFKNNVWVEGTVNNARLTILAFTPLFTQPNATDIYLNNNLLTSTSTDAIGLIAQRNIMVGQDSLNDLVIDAALIAKTGWVRRGHYPTGCNNSNPHSITINGAIATAKRYGFAYLDTPPTGYQIRNINFNGNFRFSPPPHFPTTGEYTFISWREN
jgi:hypothetical protein